MLRFIWNKILKKKWMFLALLLGNILLIAVTAANPLYVRGILQKSLRRELSTTISQNNTWPGAVYISASSTNKKSDHVAQYREKVSALIEDFGLTPLAQTEHLRMQGIMVESAMGRDSLKQNNLSLGCISGLEEHIELIHGRFMSDTVPEDGVLEVIAAEQAYVGQNLLLNEVLRLPYLTDDEDQPIRIRLVGVYRPIDQTDQYWTGYVGFTNEVLLGENVFARALYTADGTARHGVQANWNINFDWNSFTVENLAHLADCSARWDKALTSSTVGGFSGSYSDNFKTIADKFLAMEAKLRVTLTVLQLPVFALLAAFMVMLSAQILSLEAAEIAVIRSRGASKGQILLIYLVQGLLLQIPSLLLGFPLGALLTQALGSANAFLEFVSRSSLPLLFDRKVILYGFGAALVALIAELLPALRYAREGIVSQKRKKQRKETPFWQRFYLDFVILGVGLYGLYSYRQQEAYLADMVAEGTGLDPLLFLSSSLFLLGAGLVVIRLIPLVSYLVYRPFKSLWPASLHVSFLGIQRNRSSQYFIMLFLIMTTALGVFNADAARTVNENREEEKAYSLGADVVLREHWSGGTEDKEGAVSAYLEPDFERYLQLEGTECAARVYRNTAVSANLGALSLKNITCMAINTVEFGNTAWFDSSLLDTHWYNYLNALAENTHGILVSSNFRDEQGLALGDPLRFSYKGSNFRGIICGFVDYWPTFRPVSTSRQSDGTMAETQNYLIVANLGQLQSEWGLAPYEVWIKTREDSDYLYQYARERSLGFESFRDLREDLLDLKNDPMLQGTNGILSLSFMVVLILGMIGYLIYWITSIKGRSLQFGILRAMGLPMRGIGGLLTLEQIFISALPIAAGLGVGKLTAKLYIPLIQIAYSTADSVLPLKLISDPGDLLRILLPLGGLLLISLGILLALVAKLKISQALKLGED